MMPPVGSAVGGKTAGGSAGGANPIGRTAIEGRAVGGAAKPGAQKAATQHAATLSLSVGPENFTPRMLRRPSGPSSRASALRDSAAEMSGRLDP
jgi:hypothetical protein